MASEGDVSPSEVHLGLGECAAVRYNGKSIVIAIRLHISLSVHYNFHHIIIAASVDIVILFIASIIIIIPIIVIVIITIEKN